LAIAGLVRGSRSVSGASGNGCSAAFTTAESGISFGKGRALRSPFFCAQSGTGHFIHGARPRVVIDAIEQVAREAREKETMTDAR
jgi:hypothetical protein